MSDRADAIERAARALGALGPRVRRDVPIGTLTTYRVGGDADLFVEAAGPDDLRAVRAAVSGHDVPVLVLGKGSNLLIADSGFHGLALVLGEAFGAVEIRDGSVEAGGAVGLPVLARRTAAAGLTGLEWAVGVPGSVGGGVRMNAGGHGSDMARCLSTWELYDLGAEAEGWQPVSSLAYGYRRSGVGASQVVTAARFELRAGDREESEAEIAEIVRWRRENQPGGQNAGSVFTNPPEDSAGRLIDAAGLKGRRLGSAEVSPKHANFIQADPGGSADDVRRLIDMVREEVRRQAGVELVPEVRMVGFA